MDGVRVRVVRLDDAVGRSCGSIWCGSGVLEFRRCSLLAGLRVSGVRESIRSAHHRIDAESRRLTQTGFLVGCFERRTRASTACGAAACAVGCSRMTTPHPFSVSWTRHLGGGAAAARKQQQELLAHTHRSEMYMSRGRRGMQTTRRICPRCTASCSRLLRQRD